LDGFTPRRACIYTAALELFDEATTAVEMVDVCTCLRLWRVLAGIRHGTGTTQRSYPAGRVGAKPSGFSSETALSASMSNSRKFDVPVEPSSTRTRGPSRLPNGAFVPSPSLNASTQGAFEACRTPATTNGLRGALAVGPHHVECRGAVHSMISELHTQPAGSR
jgi:hypothetical protein